MDGESASGKQISQGATELDYFLPSSLKSEASFTHGGSHSVDG